MSDFIGLPVIPKTTSHVFPSWEGEQKQWSIVVKKILLATAATTAFLAATPALAQNVAPVGPRVEAIVGYDKVKALGEKDGGALFGIGAGYDFAVAPSVSLGADLEATGSTMKEGDEATAEVKAGRDLYAGVRANLAVAPNANLYVKGGYTNARLKATIAGDSFSENFDGYRLGAGGQLGIGGKAYVGSEYRYSNYEDGLSRHQVAMTVGTRF